MSRTFLHGLLVQDAAASAAGTLGALGVAPDNVYISALDTPDGELFVMTRFGETRPGMGSSRITDATIWVHDRNQDYLRIEAALRRLRYLLEGVEAQRTAEGWITTIQWLGESEDLADDVFRTVTRNAVFRVIDSGR